MSVSQEPGDAYLVYGVTMDVAVATKKGEVLNGLQQRGRSLPLPDCAGTYRFVGITLVREIARAHPSCPQPIEACDRYEVIIRR